MSITFYIFEHHQLWMMDSKAQRVFFPKTPQLCVWHTEVRRCYHFKLVSHFQLWFPIWGVLVNRLSNLLCIVLFTCFWHIRPNYKLSSDVCEKGMFTRQSVNPLSVLCLSARAHQLYRPFDHSLSNIILDRQYNIKADQMLFTNVFRVPDVMSSVTSTIHLRPLEGDSMNRKNARCLGAAGLSTCRPLPWSAGALISTASDPARTRTKDI